MSRIPKWKVEMTKVKVVFRLQFHATHIPQPGWDKLYLSFIPCDTGKATAKTTKANVRNGNCKWSDPIYETTRLIQDMRSKKYEEKLYKLVVAMGTSRSILGEVNFNLADFADASKPSSIALPLHGCEFGTILHVTVQLLTSKTGFREFEKQRELTVKGFQMISGQKNQAPAETITASSDTTSEQIDMVDARVRLKANPTDFNLREGVEELNEDYEDSAAGIDGSSCTSESLNTEKNDMSNMHEVDSFKSMASGDLGRYLHGQNPKPGTENQCVKRLLAQGSNDWSHGWSTDYSVNNDLVSSYDENNLRVRLEATQAAFIQLKLEAKSLESITDDLGAETQILTQQLAAELASGQKLTREVIILKSECSKLKDDLEDLKSEKSQFQITMRHDLGDASVNSNHGDKDLASGQNYYLQGLYLIESKLREIQNKTFLEYHGSDFDLHTDFDALGSVLQTLKQGITQKTLAFVDETPVKDFRTGILQSEQHMLGYIDHHRPQLMPHFLGIPHQIFHEEESVEHSLDAASMKEEMYELLQKLEESKIEKESLAKKIDQMECYYEALIQGLEESQKQTLNELKNSRSEHVSCPYTISTLQSQLEKMHQDMNEQLTRFAEDRHFLDSLNKELELRAISSETALKRVRMNYSVAVDRLQKDLELLSFQVLSMYESNGSIAKQTFTDALQEEAQSFSPKDDALIPLKKEQHRPFFATVQPEIVSNINNVSSAALYHSPETTVPVNVKIQMIDESNGHINGLKLEDAVSSETQRRIKLPENPILKLSRDSEGIDNSDTLPTRNQCPEPDNKSVVGSSGLEELKMSFNMQELQSNNEGQLSEIHMLNIHLEVFSEILLETLRDADAGIGHMKDHMDRLTLQLAHTIGIKESLMLRLHNALDDLKTYKEHEARTMSKCDDLTFKNHVLEAKLQDVLEENTCSIQKVFELESLLMESKVFENKYAACNEEKVECEDLLRQESLKRSCLQSEISCMNGEFKALKENLNKQSSVNDDLQKSLSLLQEKLADLYSNMISCCKQLDGFTVDGLILQQEIECKNYMGMLMHLGWFQKEAYETLVQLGQEKADIERKKDCMKNLLDESESQALYMKQKFESELVVLAKDLDFSNAVSEKVQQELQDVSEKFKISLVAEEKQATMTRELSSKLAVMENELQHATEENRNLVQKLLLLDSVNEDFEKVKLSYTNCLQENKNLTMSIQTANQASIQIENEFKSLKETLRYAHDELECERRFSEELEGAVTDLTSQLKEKGQELLSFNEQKAELAYLRKRISDVEAENSRLGHILLQTEEFQRGLEGETFSLRLQVAEMENHMTAIFECSLTTEIELTFMRSQFLCRVHEFTGHCKALEGDLEKLHSTHVETAAALKLCMVKEEQLVNENYRLSEALHSLKSELEKVTSEKNVLVDYYINKNNETQTEVEDMKIRFATVEADNGQEKEKYVDEICQLKNMLVSFEKEVDNLRVLRDELEITDTILRSKLDEQQSQILVSEAHYHELRNLREQNNDLSYKLSEQIFKTEEFKNLSLHLRELKDKADAECCQARDRRENEGPSLAVQDSLRIAFIKEQYETKFQDLINQHQVSKKYAEEMLIKLQNALGEVESGRKNEISLAKRIEELSRKISDLENELQTITTDRRELVKAYDRMKAELECTILSLDCCKEEKSKLEASLQDCHEEKAKLRVELDLVKRVLENMASITDIEAQKNLEPDFANTSIGQLLEKANSELSLVSEQTPRTGDSSFKKDSIISANIYPVNTVFKDNLPEVCCTMTSSVEEDSNLISANKISNTSLQPDLQVLQDGLVPISAVERETLLEDYTKQFPDIKEHFKEQQRLKASMDLLYNELEMLKNENLSSLITLDGKHFDPAVQVLERELTQLDMANDRLESIYPSYREFPGTANALERVLALELELAEALQAKKKSDLRFQSSFLRQHDDDAAVYQSFRDINDLMKDMLELKKRNVAVEAELKEMQGRYSQLSLQFAEVEGERQKLVMTLKNRTPRRS